MRRLCLVGWVGLCMIWGASARAEEAKKPDISDYELQQAFADTLDQIERNYVKELSRREILEAAIEGILGKLDPYSSYISPDDLGRFKTSVESQFGGIGIQVTVEAGRLKVLSPLVGTPAYRAGLLAGDTIVEIEGKSAEGITIEEAVRRLKGEAGTSVSLGVLRSGEKEKKAYTITRELIHVETVLGDRRKPADDNWDYLLDAEKKIGYVRVTAFSRDTAEDFKRVLTDLTKTGLKGLVIDLRFNPGGLLTSAVEMSDLFVSKGKIVSTKGRNTPERTWEAREEGTFEGFPVVVLVNRYSASASEIFSACLQDHQRAVVVGERTWGKGSVQNVIELEGGKSALKLTTASYQRPNGHNIHRFPDSKETDEWGVTPDKGFEVKLSDDELTQLVIDRRHRDIVLGKKAETKPGESPPTEAAGAPAKPFTDRQLQKALEYLNQQFAAAK